MAQDIPTVASPDVARRRRRLALTVVGMAALVCMIGSSIAGAGYYGFTQGVANRPVSATVVTDDPSYLVDQMQRCMDAINASNGQRAQAHCEEVLRMQPTNRGAQELRVTALALQQPTAVIVPTIPPLEPADKDAALVRFQDAIKARQWDTVINVGTQLRALDRQYEKTIVDTGLYQGLTTRGLARINAGDLEAGLFDLDLAATIRKLDDRTEGVRTIVSLYQDASYYYGADWDAAILKLRQVYAASPGFRDVSKRLFESYVRSGEDASARQDWCKAEKRFASAAEMSPSAELESRRASAQSACLLAATFSGTVPISSVVPISGFAPFTGTFRTPRP